MVQPIIPSIIKTASSSIVLLKVPIYFQNEFVILSCINKGVNEKHGSEENEAIELKNCDAFKCNALAFIICYWKF